MTPIAVHGGRKRLALVALAFAAALAVILPDPALALQRVPKPRARTGSGTSGSTGTSKPAAGDAPSAAEVAKLYGVTGRELKALEGRSGMDATIELWPRYRWIRINEWIATPERRTQVASILERLRADIRAVH